jgi:hypothetical protein
MAAGKPTPINLPSEFPVVLVAVELAIPAPRSGRGDEAGIRFIGVESGPGRSTTRRKASCPAA